MIIRGDCLDKLKELEENSVDAIVTDPPYGLSFMGKNWDFGVPGKAFFEEMIRVLKPGGFLLAFGGTRTYHRLACGIEDAGFEIRDCIQWLYGSGFPKSLNIGKQIDKMQGNEREVVGEIVYPDGSKSRKTAQTFQAGGNGNILGDTKLTKGTSEWEGWGTALKPANEPIVVARKPLSEKNVALNVLKWGTGGINIDACRVGSEIIKEHKSGDTSLMGGLSGKSEQGGHISPEHQGRFPANIILDEEAGKMLDEQSGISKSKKGKVSNKGSIWNSGNENIEERGHNDKGGASRFFYCAKASKKERNFGCEEFEDKDNPYGPNAKNGQGLRTTTNRSSEKTKNNHPTVKPIKLMEYLIKLVSKEGATVLDPFLGSGTTGVACVKLNRNFIGIEKEEEYIKIAEARIKAFEDKIKEEGVQQTL